MLFFSRDSDSEFSSEAENDPQCDDNGKSINRFMISKRKKKSPSYYWNTKE